MPFSFLDLPDELLCIINIRMPANDHCAIQATCKQLHSLCTTPEHLEERFRYWKEMPDRYAATGLTMGYMWEFGRGTPARRISDARYWYKLALQSGTSCCCCCCCLLLISWC
eukprot:TRINITY_DN575_c0_g1_i1.p2 TRINITY_DN575_c0_g1~~TRINITY_DN575_c0_g1_i1.p2  ORF type:complete len:112 (+),score=10.50 TRINITY_DN575_c0_g1_i1:99-434(+)